MESSRIPGGAMLGLILLIITLPPAAVGTAVQGLADDRWNDVDRETWTRYAALQKTSLRRPVLRGEPLPGNAWTDYAKAGAGNHWAEFEALSSFVNGTSELSREQAQALLELFLPMLGAIQSGTHRAELVRMLSWNDPLPTLFSGWQGTKIGICRARFLVEQGDIAGAVELLLDLMQYLGDLGRLGRGWASYCALNHRESVLAELTAMMAKGVLGREELRQIARELRMLERSVPPLGTIMRDQAMFTALRVLRTRTVEKYLAEVANPDLQVPTWKFGFSQKLLLSRYAELEYRVAEGIARGDGRPWAESRQRTVEACEEASAARHPFNVWKGNPTGKVDWLWIHRGYLECIAHFRLTRAAAEYLAEGRVPELDDPYGDKLRWSRSGTAMRIWSVGWDGVDQGGRGGWAGKSGPDLVLEVRR